MKRREFITLLGGAATWPVLARAQQPVMPVIGFLSSRSPGESTNDVGSFRQGLKEAGYIEGQNVHIAFRWADGQYDRLPELAAELVRSRVAVIAATGGVPSGLAAKAATATIPIVATAGDPVRAGLVASLSRPGGNVTAIAPLSSLLEAKRLGLLRELVPAAAVIGVLVDPNYPDTDFQLNDVQEAARTLGLQIRVVNAGSERDFEAAFVNLVQQRVDAVLVTTSTFFVSRRDQIIALAARHAMPAIYSNRTFAIDGGLICYAPSISDAYHQVGVYTGRILKGEKTADLPVWQTTKFELVINLKTAKAFGLTVPTTLLSTADEVIE